MAKKKFGPKILVFCYRDLALAVPVVLAPSEAFFDFSFPSYSRFREGTPQMRQNFGSRNCRNFAAFEGSPHENGYNSETKSRKMLPKVPKRPERRGLGPYSKKPKFLGQIFFWQFLAFFGHFLTVFGPVGIEKTIFVKSVFSKHCFYWSKRKKNPQPKSQFQKRCFCETV